MALAAFLSGLRTMGPSALAASSTCPLTSVSFEGTAPALKLNGTAALAGTTGSQFVRLTTAQQGQAGSVFTTNAIELGADASFSTAFTFRISPDTPGLDGADGIVFAVQNVSNNVGSTGGGIGYEGIGKSVGVEFDTYSNPGDPDGNHVGIDVNGNVLSAVTRSVDDLSFTLEDGDPKYAWIDYDGTTDTLEVRLAAVNTRPSTAFLTYTIDLPATLDATSGYFGFTSATGSLYDNHDITAWNYRGCDPTQQTTTTSSTPEDTTTTTAEVTTTTVVDPTTTTTTAPGRIPTKVVAYPAIASVGGRFRLAPPLPLTVSGRLTRIDGTPIAGRVVYFDSTTNGLCFAVTDATGFASCQSAASAVYAVTSFGYSARFNGDAVYLPSSSRGGLLDIFQLPLP